MDSDRQVTQDWLDSTNATIDNTRQQMQSLARQHGTDTPDYRQLWQNLNGLVGTLVNHPGSKVTPVTAKLALDGYAAEDTGQSIIGAADQMFDRAGKADAQKFLQDQLFGPGSEKLALTAQQREHLVTEGLRSLDLKDTADRQDLADHRQAVSTFLSRSEGNPLGVKQSEIDGLLGESQRLGDSKSIHHLQEFAAALPAMRTQSLMSPAERLRSLQTLGAPVPGSPGPVNQTRKDTVDATVDELTKGGMSSNAIRGMLGNIQLESGFNAGNRSTYPDNPRWFLQHRDDLEGAYAHGLYQENGVEWHRYQDWLSNNHPGSDWRDARLQNQFIAWNLKTNYPSTFQRINNAATPEQAGEIFAREYLRPKDIEGRVNRLQNIGQPAEFYAGGLGPAGSGGGTGTPGLSPGAGGAGDGMQGAFERQFVIGQNQLRNLIGEDARQSKQAIISTVNQGLPVPQSQIDEFQQQVEASGKREYFEEARQALEENRYRQRLPEVASPEAVQSNIDALMRTENDPVRRNALVSLAQHYTADMKKLTTDPLLYSGSRWTPPLQPLDTDNPNNFTAEISQRAKSADIVRQKAGGLVGAVPAVATAEGPAFANALRTGDPQKAGAMLETLRTTLSPQDYRATLANDDIKKAVIGMAGSPDPVRMLSGMQAMQSYWLADPHGFRQVYKDDADNLLQSWMAQKDLFTPAEIAGNLNEARPSDPDVVAKKDKEFEKELSSRFTRDWNNPDKIAMMLPTSQWWQRWAPLPWSVTGGGPPIYGDMPHGTIQMAPDDRQSQRMKVEFTEAYKALRYNGATPDAAADGAIRKLGATWTPSPVNQGRIMQFAPETAVNPENGQPYYPNFNGSRQWMIDQLDRELGDRYGRTLVSRGGGWAAEPEYRNNATIAGIAADAQTEGEISHPKRDADGNVIPPSYVVVVRNDHGGFRFGWGGQLEVLTTPDGRPARYRWDPASADRDAAAALMRAAEGWRNPQLNALVQGASPASAGAAAGAPDLTPDQAQAAQLGYGLINPPPGSGIAPGNYMPVPPEVQREHQRQDLGRRESFLSDMAQRGWGGAYTQATLARIRAQRRALDALDAATP